jgi:hypothetical protein
VVSGEAAYRIRSAPFAILIRKRKPNIAAEAKRIRNNTINAMKMNLHHSEHRSKYEIASLLPRKKH